MPIHYLGINLYAMFRNSERALIRTHHYVVDVGK